MARLPTLLLAVLALLSAGCGGGSGSGPEETVRNYLDAVVMQNGRLACAQLTTGLRRDIERSPAARSAGRSCADVMALAAGLNPGLTTDDVDGLEIAVSEDGDRATATFENPLSRRRETIDLVRSGGDWKIATLQTRPSG